MGSAMATGFPYPQLFNLPSALSVALANAASFAEILALLAENVVMHLKADGVTLVVREDNECHYVDELAIAPLWKGRRFPLVSCISGWSMVHQEPVYIPDIYCDVRIPHDLYRPTFVNSLLMLPIGTNPAVGALGIYWSDRHDLVEDEIDACYGIATSAALALDRVTRAAPL